MKSLLFLVLLSVMSFGAVHAEGLSTKDVCDTLPPECVAENGDIDVECVCKIWCHALCGGAACNCDILPEDKVDTPLQGLVNKKEYKQRIDKILSGDKKK